MVVVLPIMPQFGSPGAFGLFAAENCCTFVSRQSLLTLPTGFASVDCGIFGSKPPRFTDEKRPAVAL